MVAAILAGISVGIERGLQAPVATVGNAGAELSGNLPMTWDAALAAFTDSEFVREYFGEEFQRVYAGIKQQEMDEFARSISTLEYHTYL